MFTQSKELTCLDSRSSSCSWAASHASCVTQHIILKQDICNSYSRVCNPKYTKAFGCFPPQSFVWRREQWWLQCVARRPRYVVECEAVRNPLLSLSRGFLGRRKSRSSPVAFEISLNHRTSNIDIDTFLFQLIETLFLRPDRLFRDPGVIIKELLVKATQLLWLGQMTAISLVFKCIANIVHSMFMLHICHSFDSSMLSLPLHSAMPRICLQHRIWLQM